MAVTYRDLGTSGTQLEIISSTLVIGHDRKNVLTVMASSEARWSWHFRMTGGPPGFQQHGDADTCEEAKAAVERNWQAWRTAAGLREER